VLPFVATGFSINPFPSKKRGSYEGFFVSELISIWKEPGGLICDTRKGIY
jgi:hypothetical protein